MNFSKDDINYMQFALQIAKKEEGQVWPNPAVGCVVVNTHDNKHKKIDRIVGTGFTYKHGGPHAETVALQESGELAVGSTLYVTLEPCCHKGKNPPCTDAIIKSKIKKVVVATLDPNPLVSGKGVEALREKNIEVSIGCCESEAQEQLLGFLTRIKTKKPRVTLKIAVSSDNCISQIDKKRLKITSPKVDSYIHAIRARYDGILIGNGTFKHDDPQLNVRLNGYSGHNPAKFLLSANGIFDLNSNLYRNIEESPLYMIVGKNTSSRNISFLEKNGVNVILVNHEQKDSFLDLQDVLLQLGGLGINNLFVEPGNTLLKNLIQQNIPDDILIFRSDTAIKEKGIENNYIKNLINNRSKKYMLANKKIIFDSELTYLKRKAN